MKEKVIKHRLGYVMMVMIVSSFALMITNTAFAKCPCYKDKDLEKLLDKGWGVEWFSQGPDMVDIMLKDPAGDPDFSMKGKKNEKLFVWQIMDGEFASCHTYEYQLKWKGDPWSSKGKAKDMREGIPIGHPDEIECKAILDDIIANFPPM